MQSYRASWGKTVPFLSRVGIVRVGIVRVGARGPGRRTTTTRDDGPRVANCRRRSAPPPSTTTPRDPCDRPPPVRTFRGGHAGAQSPRNYDPPSFPQGFVGVDDEPRSRHAALLRRSLSPNVPPGGWTMPRAGGWTIPFEVAIRGLCQFDLILPIIWKS
jgi:hypothetical protein